MSPEAEPRQTPFFALVWRRKWVVVATFLTFVVVTALVSTVLPKVYSTSSTLLVSGPRPSFDSTQLAQVVARSYADILGSPNIARRVAKRLGHSTTSQSLQDAVTIEPVPETELIKIAAEDSNPNRAKQIADAYATEFIAYSQQNLARSTSVRVSLADAAPRPHSATRPRPLLYTLVAAIVGLLVGLGFALLRDRLDSGLRSPEEIEQEFGVPVLARVPQLGRGPAGQAAFTEAFRVLHTNLQFASPGSPPRTIAVTSATAGEGKTTVLTQLALATAATEASVLAVEADLRNPALQSFFDRTRREPLRPGLINYVVGGIALDEIIHETKVPNVELVPAGPRVPSLWGVLASDRGEQAVADLAQAGDLVLFDCPALRSGADAATLAGYVDGVVLVVDVEKARRQTIREALRALEAVHARVLGFVLNKDSQTVAQDAVAVPGADPRGSAPPANARVAASRRGPPAGNPAPPAAGGDGDPPTKRWPGALPAGGRSAGA